MTNLNQILAATTITLSALVMGCTSTPNPGQFKREQVIFSPSPLGGPAHPAIMAIYAGRLECKKIEKNEKVIGINVRKSHWLGFNLGSKEIYFPEGAEFVGLSQARGRITIVYKLNGRTFREEYSLGLSPSANDMELRKREWYNQDRKKWEKEN